jgi:ppGpp synthetase/RelA/SpoT-type nucleotidyltranferase
MSERTLEKFLLDNKISQDQWDSSGLHWDVLAAIGDEYDKRVSGLEETAALLANIIQGFDAVHSVRWRVKDVEHLLAKIVRKCSEGKETYKNINAENYGEIITDLIGIRALHLFKVDFLKINKFILDSFVLKDAPVVYVRDGDDPQFSQLCADVGFKVEPHPKGYRSIHYVITTQPLKHRVHVELQVRTIFEEGWSEIDHIVRYPNYSDDAQLAYLLTIFNRMAGSADEMGGFVRNLAEELKDSKVRLESALRERDESLTKAEDALEQLAAAKTDPSDNQKIAALQSELQKLKSASDAAKQSVSGSVSSKITRLHAALTPHEYLNEVRAMKAIEDPGGIKAAMKAIEDPAGIKAAMKAIEDPGGIKAAMKAIEDPGGIKAAMKDLGKLN